MNTKTKLFIFGLITLFGVFTSLNIVSAQAASGDVNGDGSINCTDVRMILESVVGNITLTSDQRARADVSGDGMVSAYDASLIMQRNGLSCNTPTASGDVNGDGSINCTDTKMILDSVVGNITLTSDQRARADVSGDGSVTAYDASLIMQRNGLSCNTPVSNPTVNLTADNSNVNYGGSTYLHWTTSNATSCNATGGTNGWAGSKNASGGNFLTGALYNTTTYYITCSNSSGSANDSVIINVGQQPQDAPTVNISADDTSLNYGDSTTIRWTTTGSPTSCVASGDWSGNKSTSGGYQPTGNLYLSKTYTIRCSNNSGSDTDSVTINVSQQPPQEDPTVNISASNTNLNYGGSTYITWHSTNTDSCQASGAWSGSKAISGSYLTGALYSNKTYTITCMGEGGVATDSVTIYVNQQPPQEDPTVNLTANPTHITEGESAVLNWSSTNADSCSASWTTSTATTGYKTVYPTITKTYLINCEGAGGEVSDSVTVYVDNSQEPNEPTVNISAEDTSLNYGASTYITWNSDNADFCSATGGANGWAGSKGTSGSFYTGSLYNTEIYTIRCTNNDDGSASDSVTIYVNEEEDNIEPTVSTRAATNIDEESATLNGFVDSNGGSDVEVWFEWDTNSNYDNHTSHLYYGSTSGINFNYDLDGLDSDETYYFRAVARNSLGEEIYGSQKTFTTDEDGNNNNNDDESPDVTTYSATEVDSDSATLNGYVDTNGTSTRRWFEWGTRSSSLFNDTSKSSNSASSRNFEQAIYNLSPNTTYYFRAVAENSNDIDYGNILSFRTRSNNYYYNDTECDYGTCAPTAITTMATNIGPTSARLNGLSLTNNAVYTTGYFEYGTSQALGNATNNTNVGNTQSNPFYENLPGLVSGITYYYRAVVTNQYGISRGDILSFRTINPATYNNTNTNTVYRNTTVVTNNTIGNSKSSLVSLSVDPDGETIRKGDIVEYEINYKNVSSKNLRDVVLQISIPKELEFMEASRGYFSTENSVVVVNIGDLNPQEEGSIHVTVKVTTSAQTGKIIVITANLAYTISSTGVQEEIFAYAKNTVENGETVQQGALAFLFGDGSFLPSTLLGWLLLILIITLVVLAARKTYYGYKVATA
jgi:hypothetical protein